MLSTDNFSQVWTVVFHPDGKHLLGGSREGVRRWQLADGREVGRQMDMDMYAISVSKDCKWIVCGTMRGASVWDGEMHHKVMDVEGTNVVCAVDVSPDSRWFATGTYDNASIWSITPRSGEPLLVGSLKHSNGRVNGIRFSPDGEHIATACRGESIQIFDSRTGANLKLITINIVTPDWVGITPFAWSSNSQQIFAASNDNKVRSFDTSTGSQLAESQILHDGSGNNVLSVALAASGKFVATVTRQSISFLDTSTLKQIGPVIKESEQIRPIALSADSSNLAIGQDDGKIIIRDLSNILLDSYGPFHVSSDNPGILDEAMHSVTHADQLCRYPLVKKDDKISNL